MPSDYGSVPRPPVVNVTKASPQPEVQQAGTGVTALMLARYLVGRAVAAQVSVTLWALGGILLVLGVLVWFFVGPHWFAILMALFGLIVLGVRALVMLVLRKVMAVGRLGEAEGRIAGLVHDTGGDLRRELRRIGLPGSVVGMPLLALRIMGRRRAQTFERMRRFDVANVVPRSRRAELEFIVRNDVLHQSRRRP